MCCNNRTKANSNFKLSFASNIYFRIDRAQSAILLTVRRKKMQITIFQWYAMHHVCRVRGPKSPGPQIFLWSHLQSECTAGKGRLSTYPLGCGQLAAYFLHIFSFLNSYVARIEEIPCMISHINIYIYIYLKLSSISQMIYKSKIRAYGPRAILMLSLLLI